MRSVPILLLAVLVLTAGALLGSCQSTDLTADPEGELRLSANPATVIIDQPGGQTEGQSTIAAQVLDADSFAMEGVSVFFSTSGGQLASGGAPGSAPTPVRTNANGIAVDVLTLGLADPRSVDVTATSGTLTATVAVNKTISTGNALPTAVISATPATQQVKGRQVTFNGGASSDPDGEITCYQFAIDSTENARDEVVQGTSKTYTPATYTVEQQITVTLRVSDTADAGTTFCAPGAGTAPASSFQDEAVLSNYRIVCAILPPTANAGADKSVSAAGGTVAVSLSGTGTATDAAIAGYEWDCGNGEAVKTGQQVTCNYRNFDAPNNTTYTATLTVTDVCGLRGTDQATITVRP